MIEKPVWNSELNDWEVCGECLEAIFSVFEDTPEHVIEDEEFDPMIVNAEDPVLFDQVIENTA